VKSLCVVTVGAIGRQIGVRVGGLRPAQWYDATDGLDRAGLPLTDAYLLAAGRQVPELEQDLDAVVHDWRRVLLTVAVEHPVLRVGPLVVPGSGAACAGCYHLRCRTHLTGTDAVDSLTAHFRANPHDEPEGYLPPMLDFAAGQAHALLAAVEAGRYSEAGTVRMTHLLAPRVYRWSVVGVHGCPRCGTGGDERDRSTARLVSALAGAVGDLSSCPVDGSVL
jgi:bacteriocin biosynthesis cyclodehydratase domain-containing protein